MEITDEVRSSLSRAGIGRIYHERALSSLGEQHPIATWFKRMARPDILAGRGFVLVGASPDAYDAFMLAARRLHMNGVGVGVVHMSDLIEHITRVDRHERVERATALFIKGFYVPAANQPAPYEPRELRRVTHYLDDWMEERRPLFVQATANLTPQQPGWWRDDFIARVQRVSETLEVRS